MCFLLCISRPIFTNWVGGEKGVKGGLTLSDLLVYIPAGRECERADHFCLFTFFVSIFTYWVDEEKTGVPALLVPINLMPFTPKSGFGVCVCDGLSGTSRDGLTVERCSQLAAFAIHPVG